MKTVFCLLAFLSPVWGGWSITVIDSMPTHITGFALGDGRGDKVMRIFITAQDNVYELSYTGNTWIREEIDSISGAGPIAIGAARNDGVIHLYIAGKDKLFELTRWSNGWSKSVVGTIDTTYCFSAFGIVIGAGRNDNVMRVYLFGGDEYVIGNSRVYEYSFNGTNWARSLIVSSGDCIMGLAIGPGRNDGINRMYVSSDSFYELSYSADKWTMSSLIDAWESWGNIIFGPGRNDKINRMYGYGGGEYSFDTGKWNTTSFTRHREVRVEMGTGRNDGIIRLYATNGTLYESTYLQPDWVEIRIGKIRYIGVPWENILAVGCGRNDSVVRVYTRDQLYYDKNSDENIYEFSWANINITSPVKSDNWQSGKNYEIKWNWTQELTNVALWFSVDGGTSWSVINQNTLNTGTYPWTINKMWVSSNQCMIKIIDNNNPDGNFAISDTFTILKSTGVKETAGNLFTRPFLEVFPSLFSKKTGIRYGALPGTTINLKIFDTSGRVVKNLINSQSSELKVNSILWDGSDDHGHTLPRGIYICIMEANNLSSVSRFTQKIVFER